MSMEVAGEKIDTDALQRVAGRLMQQTPPTVVYATASTFLLYLKAREESGGSHSRRVYGECLNECLNMLELTRADLS